MSPPSARTTNQTHMTGPKNLATRSVPRDCIQNKNVKNQDRQRNNGFLEVRRDELQALDGRQNRNCRRDDGVAVEERCAGYAEGAQQRRAALGDGLAERHESEHAALALVVGPEQHQHVLQRDDEQQCSR